MKEIPIACFLLAFVFNIVSCVSQEGLGDEVFTDVDACRSNEDLHLRCFHPVVSGGFPFSYAFDRLSVSVPYSIFFEDNFRLFPFILNIWIYFLILLGIFIAIRQEVIRHTKK